MATQADISSSDRKHLAALMTIEVLGGTLQDAVIQHKATMSDEDVDLVEKDILKMKKAHGLV